MWCGRRNRKVSGRRTLPTHSTNAPASSSDRFSKSRARSQGTSPPDRGTTTGYHALTPSSLAHVKVSRALEPLARVPQSQTEIDAAVADLEDFEQMDRRAREYVRGGQRLLASDLVFSDGIEKMDGAVAAIERARLAESTATQETITARRREQLLTAGGAAAARGADHVHPRPAAQGRARGERAGSDRPCLGRWPRPAPARHRGSRVGRVGSFGGRVKTRRSRCRSSRDCCTVQRSHPRDRHRVHCPKRWNAQPRCSMLRDW